MCLHIIHFLLTVNVNKMWVQTHFLLLFVNKKYPVTYILYYEKSFRKSPNPYPTGLCLRILPIGVFSCQSASPAVIFQPKDCKSSHHLSLTPEKEIKLNQLLWRKKSLKLRASTPYLHFEGGFYLGEPPNHLWKGSK